MASYAPENLQLKSSKPYYGTSVVLHTSAGSGDEIPDIGAPIPVFPTSETYVRYHSEDGEQTDCILLLLPMAGYQYVPATVIANASDTDSKWRLPISNINYTGIEALYRRILGG